MPGAMRRRHALTFDTAREIARALPGVEDGTTYGTPALKVRGTLLSCIPTHKSAEPDSLAIRVDFAQREELLAAAPDTYYCPVHYVNYPIVLVRLSRIHQDELRDLIRMAWESASRKPTRRKRRDRLPPAPVRPRR